MKKESTATYAKALIAKNGVWDAKYIATKAFENSKPSTWSTLPVGDIFYDEVEHFHSLSEEEKKTMRSIKYKSTDGTDVSKSYVLKLKTLKYTNNFWKNVLGIVTKAEKKARK